MARSSLYPPSVDAGFPVLPPRPEGWTRAAFRDVVEPVERPVRLDPDRIYRLLTAKRSRGGIVLRSELPGREILTKTQFEAKAGDFLISRRQIIHGACGIVSAELDGSVVSNEYSTLRVQPSLKMDFLQHYSHTSYFQRTCFHSSHGVDVEKMVFKLDQWLGLPVDVPPLGEQRKIAAILSSVDNAIDDTQAVIDQLHIVKQAMMAELMTRGLPGRHTRFKQTEIGEVPETWEVTPIQSVIESCDYGLSKALSPDDSGVPVLRMGNLHDGHVVLEDLKFVAVEEVDSSLYLEAGDVLFNRTNSAALVGKIGLFSGASRPVSFASYLLRLRPRKGSVDGTWLACVMHMDRNQATIRALATPGVSQVNVNRGRMLELAIPVAPLAEQREIMAVIAGLQSRMNDETVALCQLGKLKSALLSALLTGELRVTPDQESA